MFLFFYLFVFMDGYIFMWLFIILFRCFFI